MRRLGTTALLAALIALGVSGTLRAADDDGPAPKKTCHQVDKRAQYRGLGYQHVVVIRNVCDHAIDCTIKASSNPDTLTAKVEAKGSEEIVVNSGSAASEFSADVQCK